MNRSHESLIKLARFQVEELQRQMADADRARDRLRQQVEKLDADLVRERKTAASNPEAAATFGAYASAMKTRKENLKVSLTDIDRQAETVRNDLQAAFEQLKKYELLEERRQAALQARERAAEQAELDEIAQRKQRA
jgi:flagellar export protein FliJ